MLDTEPTDGAGDGATTSASAGPALAGAPAEETAATAAAARPRRRRAASRPAGPPQPAAGAHPPAESQPAESAESQPAAPQPAEDAGPAATDLPAPAVPAEDDAAPARAKRTRRTTKKTAAAPPAESAGSDGAEVPEGGATDEAPTEAPAPRARRTRKKAAPDAGTVAAPADTESPAHRPEPPTGPAADLPTEPEAPAEAGPAEAADAVPAVQTPLGAGVAPPAAPTVLFQPPQPVERPARRRRATSPTTAPAPLPPAAAPAAAAPGGASGDSGTAAPAAEADSDVRPGDPGAGGAGRGQEVEELEAVELDADEDDEGAEDSTVEEGSVEEGAGRRRRRRGGRGRRSRARSADAGGDPDGDDGPDGARSGPGGDAPEDSGAEAEADEGRPGGQAADADGDEEGGSASSRRRRRRRRRGGASGDEPELGPDDPEHTVVHVREPRRRERGESAAAKAERSARSDEVTSVKGSTRLEAKKQRRRDGRDQGRRRPPVITESEFLARRESVERVMVVRQVADRTQIAVLEDDVLVEHYVNRETSTSFVGNVYLGKVQNVLPSMEAAFVDIGKGRNAVLYAGEVNWDAAGLEGQPKRIEVALKSGDAVLVQVTKDPIGHKGARLTSQISLPGRYLVYVPDGSMTGISRKLPDTERSRLKQILKRVVPEDAGVIVRTAAEGATEAELERDVARLSAQWEDITRKAKSAAAPALLYGEPDLTVRVVRDVFNEDFARLVVAGDEAWDVVESYVGHVAPDLAARLERWTGTQEVFRAHRIDEQLTKALDRKVWLPSGGYLVIDDTEAMTVVDVNTGKFTGKGGNLEETVTKNNLEAAEELVRQLRLRDVGGIIVVDFIDMVLESNRDLVMRRLLECLGRDRTKHQVAEVTSLGLVQMTRKRVGQGLLQVFSTPCDRCNGRGHIVSLDPVETPAVAAADGAAGGRRRDRRGDRPGEVPPARVGRPGDGPAAVAAASRAAALRAMAGDIEASPVQPGEAAAVARDDRPEGVAEAVGEAAEALRAELAEDAAEAVGEAAELPVAVAGPDGMAYTGAPDLVPPDEPVLESDPVALEDPVEPDPAGRARRARRPRTSAGPR